MMKQLIRKVRELQHLQAVCLEKKYYLKKTNSCDIATNNNSNNSNRSGSSDVNTVETVMKHHVEHLINMDNFLEEAICYTDTIYQQSSSTSSSSSSKTSRSTIDYNVYNNNHINNHQHQHIHHNNQHQYSHIYNQPQQFNYNSSSLNNNSDHHHHLNYRVIQPPLPQQPPPPKLFQPSMNAPLSHINAPLSHINIPFPPSNAFFPPHLPTFKFLPPLPTSQPPIIPSPPEIPQSISPSLVASSSSIPLSQSLNESDPYDYTKILLSTITKIKQNICETVDDGNKDIKINDGKNHENEDTAFALKKRKSKWDS